METVIYKTAQGLADIMGYGTVSYIIEENMAQNERGFSGAEVVRKKVFFNDGTSMPMIFKFAERKERCAMKLLSEQGQHTPAAYSQDVISDEPAWMAMEDLGQKKNTNPYAPFYIDLAGWFTADNIKMYYDELSVRGISLKYKDFEERARTAFRYNGFIYLCPSVMDWQDEPTGQTGRRLLQSLKIILDGDFPERRIHYSDHLFHKLTREYQ